jgi:hypothetical protein
MSSATFDVPLALALAAAAVLGALQAAAYVLAARGIAALDDDPTGLARVAATLLVLAAGAAVAGVLTPAHPTASMLATFALGIAATLGWAALRRRAAWRLVLAAPAAARGLALPAGRVGAGAVAAALVLATATAGLGTGSGGAVPAWAPVLAALALRPPAALVVAALAALAETTFARLVPAVAPAEVAGLAVAALALSAPPLRVARTP